MPRTVVFADGFAVTTGHTVKVQTKGGTTGEGIVTEIVESQPPRIRIAMNPLLSRTKHPTPGLVWDWIATKGVRGEDIVRA